MKKVLAASMGLLLGVATVAQSETWSRDPDPAETLDAVEELDAEDALDADGKPDPDKKQESLRSAVEGRSSGGTRSNDSLARTTKPDPSAKPDPASAMFEDVETIDSNQRDASAYSGGDARSQAMQGTRQRQAGAYQAQAGREAYQARASGYAGGDSSQFDDSQREGSGFRGDRGYDEGSREDESGYASGKDYRYTDRYDSRYSGRNNSRYTGRYDSRYGRTTDKRYDGIYDGYRGDYDNYYRDGYDRRYGDVRGGYSSGYGQGYGQRYAYDQNLGYRGKWNNQSYQSPWRYQYPSGYGARSWNEGLYLPSAYHATNYYIDPAPYGLMPPPYGYAWVRVDADVLLVDVRTGLIVDVLHGFFY